MRYTSLEAFNTLKNNGILTGLRLKVYETLFHHGPLTQGELWNEFFSEAQRHSIAPRFAELEKMGLIRTVGQRPCSVTGTKALEWDVTDHVPESKEKALAATVKLKLQDIAPEIVALLTKMDKFLKSLPEGGMSEVLQYDINNLKEKLQ